MNALALILILGSAPISSDAFTFAKPDKTRLEEVVRRVGPPAVEHAAWLIENEIDPFVDVPTPSKLRDVYARAGSRRVIEAHVAAWDTPQGRARLVFRGGTLWFAVLPTDETEAIGAETRTITQRAGDLVMSWTLATWPEQGIGVLTPSSGGPPARRLLFPARRAQPETRKTR